MFHKFFKVLILNKKKRYTILFHDDVRTLPYPSIGMPFK